MKQTQFEQRILGYVSRATYQPLSVKALARQLRIAEGEYREFNRTIRSLVRVGRLSFGKNRKIRLPDPHGTAVGIFRSTEKGHGFVRPHPPKTGLNAAGTVTPDVFIHRNNVGDAASGDEVLVRITKAPTQGRRRPEGRIVQIVERATHHFVGSYFEEGEDSFVRVDGTVFAEPIYTGDAGRQGGFRDGALPLAGSRG
jgi:ribonuclease R